jgi:zinc-binding alcohol dehydrogenase family protein
MRAVAYQESLPITEPNSLMDVDLPKPEAGGRDLLVQVRAVSVNPVDAKVRLRARPEPGGYKVLGWDAAGVVLAAGPEATRFKPGDAVFYAGAIGRPGSNAEFQLVDERIVGPKPATLDFPAAAALPLTSITAWEILFDRLEVTRPVPGAAKAILIIGGAGGVGSIAIQLVRALTGLTVLATASRETTRDWVRGLGAHHVLDHGQPLVPQVAGLGLGAPGYVFSTTHSDQHLKDVAALIAPQGHYALIDDPGALDVMPLKPKSVALHWESMFTRSTFGTPDLEQQGQLLTRVSELVDQGRIRSTLAEDFGAINAANLRRAHALMESHKACGKIVLSGF